MAACASGGIKDVTSAKAAPSTPTSSVDGGFSFIAAKDPKRCSTSSGG
eukprot:CAMPEP_0115131682 /NCGR_PEP_ID=MMETSP0227-20121206/53272_1 /TAXON_ID=89957 /ORGANISM="Polarella glacialis, Strain CCMP 1383" /LENGTH=47 /DNA_ID= /DNA_START= /DNA_END= /DNA_ORIENTATION=